jgi:hypothetical protein
MDPESIEMRANVTTPNRHYSKGRISTMMIVNIILAVLIVGAIGTLLTVDEQNQLTTSSNSPANATIAAGSPKASNTQAEIDGLKKQLELETTKLNTLRKDKNHINDLSKASEANSLQLDTLDVETDTPAEKPTE